MAYSCNELFFSSKIFPVLSFLLFSHSKRWSNDKITEHFKSQQPTNSSVFKEEEKIKGKSQLHARASLVALSFQVQRHQSFLLC